MVPDFSNCGYHGGGVALPNPKDVPVRATVKASGGEDGPQIQAAIDAVSKLSPDPNGVRGAVLLTRGTYHIAGVIKITHGGVVLRGEGEDMKGTVLIATGTKQRTLITVSGNGAVSIPSQPPAVPDKAAPDNTAPDPATNDGDQPLKTSDGDEDEDEKPVGGSLHLELANHAEYH